MKAKAVMRWTCASCGEPKDVRFNNMKKVWSGKAQVFQTTSRTTNKANAKGKDGRPSVSMLHCNHQFVPQTGFTTSTPPLLSSIGF